MTGIARTSEIGALNVEMLQRGPVIDDGDRHPSPERPVQSPTSFNGAPSSMTGIDLGWFD